MAEDLQREHVDILMKEFAAMREEVLLHFRNAKLHVRYFTTFTAGILAIVWYLFINAPSVAWTDINNIVGTKADMLFYVVSATAIFSYYFAFDILDSYFCLYLAGARLANIEDQINGWAHRNLLVWESIFQGEPVTSGPARVLVTFWQIVIIAVIGLIIPLTCYAELLSGALIGPQWKLSHPSWVGIAWWALIALFIVFLLTFIDVFFFHGKWARRAIDRIASSKDGHAAPPPFHDPGEARGRDETLFKPKERLPVADDQTS